MNPRITFSGSASVLFIVLLAVIVRSASPSADARRAEASPGAEARSAKAAASGVQQAPAAPATAAAPAATTSAEAAFLSQYCIGCHNQRAKIGGLALDTLDVSRVGPASKPGKRSSRRSARA
jgi:mono/diheme cytochrome c family protein